MLNLEELRQLVTFVDLGTLSAAAEELHLSQPTLTRSMHHLERDFGVPLFERGKNRIALSETGLEAARQARALLAAAEDGIARVQETHRRLSTIVVESCAPAPLWTLLPQLSAAFPGQPISSSLAELEGIADDVLSGACDLGVVPYPVAREELSCQPIARESLFVCVPSAHELAGHNPLSFGDLNGHNCLLRSEIGFWDRLCREKMPASRFLVQTDDSELDELIRTSTLLCFVTDLSLANDIGRDALTGRAIVPMSDACANATYYLLRRTSEVCYKQVEQQLQRYLDLFCSFRRPLQV